MVLSQPNTSKLIRFFLSIKRPIPLHVAALMVISAQWQILYSRNYCLNHMWVYGHLPHSPDTTKISTFRCQVYERRSGSYDAGKGSPIPLTQNLSYWDPAYFLAGRQEDEIHCVARISSWSFEPFEYYLRVQFPYLYVSPLRISALEWTYRLNRGLTPECHGPKIYKC